MILPKLATWVSRARDAVEGAKANLDELFTPRGPSSSAEIGIMRGLSSESDSKTNAQEKTMKLIRACFLVLAVLLPTSWTIARAEDAPKDDKGGEMKKEKKAKKSKKKEGGDMGDMKKGDADKK